MPHKEAESHEEEEEEEEEEDKKRASKEMKRPRERKLENQTNGRSKSIEEGKKDDGAD